MGRNPIDFPPATFFEPARTRPRPCEVDTPLRCRLVPPILFPFLSSRAFLPHRRSLTQALQVKFRRFFSFFPRPRPLGKTESCKRTKHVIFWHFDNTNPLRSNNDTSEWDWIIADANTHQYYAEDHVGERTLPPSRSISRSCLGVRNSRVLGRGTWHGERHRRQSG